MGFCGILQPNKRYFRKFSTALLTFPQISPNVRSLSTGKGFRVKSEESPDQKSTLEINTKGGKLVVTTSLDEAALKSVTIEKAKEDGNATQGPANASEDPSWPLKVLHENISL